MHHSIGLTAYKAWFVKTGQLHALFVCFSAHNVFTGQCKCEWDLQAFVRREAIIIVYQVVIGVNKLEGKLHSYAFQL